MCLHRRQHGVHHLPGALRRGPEGDDLLSPAPERPGAGGLRLRERGLPVGLDLVLAPVPPRLDVLGVGGLEPDDLLHLHQGVLVGPAVDRLELAPRHEVIHPGEPVLHVGDLVARLHAVRVLELLRRHLLHLLVQRGEGRLRVGGQRLRLPLVPARVGRDRRQVEPAAVAGDLVALVVLRRGGRGHRSRSLALLELGDELADGRVPRRPLQVEHGGRAERARAGGVGQAGGVRLRPGALGGARLRPGGRLLGRRVGGRHGGEVAP